MPRISLNVIAYNEESRLEECLSDARDHVDEIVVVDQMSTDRTPEIAQRLADVYIRDVHHGHAEPSRELAASRSSGEWILILDADEKMSDLLKAELRGLVGRDVDGYWINKLNSVGGAETSTVLHYRLVRKARARFDPSPHGGATAVSENVETFDRIGIIHEKSVAEQVFDDARYERLALEERAKTSSKRSWLAHNSTLRDQRARGRRTDLEALVPHGADWVLVWGDVHVELPGSTIVPVEPGAGLDPPTEMAATEMAAAEKSANAVAVAVRGGGADAAVVALAGGDPLAVLGRVARLVRPGGVIVGTVPAARNRRGLEETVSAVLSEGAHRAPPPPAGTTRRELLTALADAGLDVRWTSLVRDGWLNPVALRPDGTGTIVESGDFLLKRVRAEVAEELTAEEIVFAAARAGRAEDGADEGPVPRECSVIVAVPPGGDPRPVTDALIETAGPLRYRLIVVDTAPGSGPAAAATPVPAGTNATLAAQWNKGARIAGGELLAFLAADTVPAPGWLEALIQTYRTRADAGAVGSKTVGADGTIEHAGLVLGSDRVAYRIYQGDVATAAHVNRPRIMPAVTAEGMITSRARFVEVGGFDETLGDDLAGADYCLRLRARGLPILYAPAAILHSSPHVAPGTRGLFRRSAREFSTRWSGASVRSDEVVCRADGRDVNGQWGRSWRLPRPSGPRLGGLPAVAWTSHFHEHGGYTEEAVAAVEALDDAGLYVVANAMAWDRRGVPAPAGQADRLVALTERDLPEDFVHVAHMGADRFKRHPGARRNIGRTMFETDGLPAGWRDRCNTMDEIWVPSEHNLRSFAAAGVAASKLHKVPETFDTDVFHPGVAPLSVDGLEGFVFLSLFAWIDRKAWDVLLRAWFEEFDARDDVTLLIKTDTHSSPPGTDCQREVTTFVRDQLKRNPRKGGRVVVLDRKLEATEVPRLYRAAQAFVLASHGEGWGRPYMEAMAMGLPTIATRWSGNLEFMNDDNSYLVGYELVGAPADSWRRGQRWAQPSMPDLRRAMRRVYQHHTEAAATGARARADVLVSCRPELVSEAVRDRLEAISRHPVHVPVRDGAPVAQPAERAIPHRAVSGGAPVAQPAERSLPHRPVTDRRRLSACVVVQDNARFLPQCRASLEGVADAIVVVAAGSTEDTAAARNEALDRVTGGWILMLDVTHTLDPASGQLVRKLVTKDRFVGYTARERHQFGLDGDVSSIEKRTAVLYPRHPDLRYVGPVGEHLLARRPGLDFRLRASRIVIHQHDYQRDRYDPVARARCELPLLERAVRDAPDEPFHRYNLGAALGWLGLHGEAEAALRQALQLAPRRASWEALALSSLARAVAAQGRTAEAVKLSRTATRRAPDWAQGRCLLAQFLAEAGREEDAISAYARALDGTDDTGGEGGDPDDVAWQVRAGLGRLHLARQEYQKAAECLSGAIATNPGNAELRVWLAHAYEALGRSGDASGQLERALTGTRAGAEAYVGMSDFFTAKAEAALLRGLADNAENRALLERIERLRSAQATA